MSKKKFSPQFERDYSFYLAQKDVFTIAGSDIKLQYHIQFPEDPKLNENNDEWNIPYSATGKNAKTCFHQLDSRGKCGPCSEPKLLVQILTCKAAVNLQIKIWAQSRAEYTLSLDELKEYLTFFQAPDWALLAVEKQKIKIIQESVKSQAWKQHKIHITTFTFHMSEMLKD